MSKVLTIHEELLIGSGKHRATYIHPVDKTKCIKISHTPDDLKEEMRYRQICAAKLEKSQLVTEFFGTVETNLGLGYVFERVRDYNGNTSLDMKKFLPKTEPDTKTLQRIWTILLNFKSDFMHENIALIDTDIKNFMVQEHAFGAYRVRIVDNIGTTCSIPLVCRLEFAAAWTAKRYWNRIVEWLAANYTEIIPPQLVEQLKEK